MASCIDELYGAGPGSHLQVMNVDSKVNRSLNQVPRESSARGHVEMERKLSEQFPVPMRLNYASYN